MPSCSQAMQLSGSIGAWARYGNSYVASMLFAAPASCVAASGFALTLRPGCAASFL
jgi:hypothetical protein